MTAVHRWCLVALGVLLIVGVPMAVRAIPPGDSDLGATELLALVTASQDEAYSGYVETDGQLQLAVSDRFTDVGTLFGERSRLRVWWRGERDWRVDKLVAQGETDLVHSSGFTTEWSYESSRATMSQDTDIRLPRTSDLVPPVLGERLLRDVDNEELSRLPTRRVAGVAAPGLRLTPASEQASIGRVDLWADPRTGIPLRIEVYADGAANPSFTSTFREFSASTPAASTTAYRPTADTDQRFDDVLDIADAANQYAPFVPPDSVAGLPKTSASDGAVGLYGAGVTQVLAVPLRGREAGPLREQLRVTPGVRQVPAGTVVMVGPLGVLRTGTDEDGGWLIAGTVTEPTLVQAAADLAAGTRYLEDHS
ncbi:MAG: hypothetical protein ACR2JD_05775 [Nocardioides sp.]